MEYLTKKEVAKVLRVHQRTVERWLIAGQLKGYKLGDAKTSLWRISSNDLQQFIEGEVKK